MEYLTIKIALLTVFLFSAAWSYEIESPSGSPESPHKLDYCTIFCGTEDALCDTMNGKCICHPGIPTIPNVPFGIKRRSLLWYCQDDDTCRKQWCHRADSYCDDGTCICQPCGPADI